MPVTSLIWRPSDPANQTKTQNVLVATTSEGNIYHWHTSSGKVLHSINLENNQVYCIDFQKQGLQFSVGCQDGVVRVYDETTKRIQQELTSGPGDHVGHSSRVCAVKYYDDNTLISGGWDNNILIWDLRRGSGSVGQMFGVHFCGESLDIRGDYILAGGYQNQDALQIWSIRDQRRVLQQSVCNEDGKFAQLYAAQFSKDSEQRFFALGGAGWTNVLFYQSDNFLNFAQAPIDEAVFALDWAHHDARCAIGCGRSGIDVYRVTRLEEVSME